VKFTAGYAAFDASDLIPEEESKDVFAYFGLAIHVANVLEHGVANGVFVASLLPRIQEFANNAVWGQAIDDLFERLFALTYGNMIRELEATKSYSQTLLDQLRDTKRTRDRLVHHFQREAAELILTPSGRRTMIDEYQTIINLFAAADEALELEIAPIRIKCGATDEWLNRAYERGIERILSESELKA